MSAAKKHEASRRPREESPRSDALTRLDLELPDGRYLLSYARAKVKPANA